MVTHGNSRYPLSPFWLHSLCKQWGSLPGHSTTTVTTWTIFTQYRSVIHRQRPLNKPETWARHRHCNQNSRHAATSKLNAQTWAIISSSYGNCGYWLPALTFQFYQGTKPAIILDDENQRQITRCVHNLVLHLNAVALLPTTNQCIRPTKKNQDPHYRRIGNCAPSMVFVSSPSQTSGEFQSDRWGNKG